MSEQKSFKAYFMTAATAFTLGLTPTFVQLGISEADAMSMPKDANVFVELNTGAAATFETFLVNQLCPQVESEFGGTCEDAAVFCKFGVDVQCVEDGEGNRTWTPNSHVRKNGNWVIEQ